MMVARKCINIPLYLHCPSFLYGKSILKQVLDMSLLNKNISIDPIRYTYVEQVGFY